MSKSNSSVAQRYERATHAQEVLARSVKRLLKPVVRLLLRHGMPFQSCVHIIKRAYLEVAQEPEFGIPGRGRSKSRLALITGMTRPDVADLIDNDRLDEVPSPERWSRAVTVLRAWATDKRYIDKKGKPKELPVRGPGSFEEMTRNYGADMPAIATMDELARVGCVERNKKKRTVKMLCPTYIPNSDAPELLEYLGYAANRMLGTMVHNIVNKTQPKRFQEECWSRSIDPAELDELRVNLRKQLVENKQATHKELKAAENDVTTDYNRSAGVGFYYFEES